MKFEDQIKQQSFPNPTIKTVLNLMYTFNWYHRKESKIFKKYGILHQHFNVLKILKGADPKPMTPGDIINVMIDSGRDLTRLVDKLVKLELVTRCSKPSNRRKVDIRITEKGKALTAKVTDEIISFSKTISNLTEEEAEQINVLLDKLRGDES